MLPTTAPMKIQRFSRMMWYRHLPQRAERLNFKLCINGMQQMLQFLLKVPLKALLMPCVDGGKFCCFLQRVSYRCDILGGRDIPAIGHGPGVMCPRIRCTTRTAQDFYDMEKSRELTVYVTLHAKSVCRANAVEGVELNVRREKKKVGKGRDLYVMVQRSFLYLYGNIICKAVPLWRGECSSTLCSPTSLYAPCISAFQN